MSMTDEVTLDGVAALAEALKKWRGTEYGDWSEVVVDAELRDAIDALPEGWHLSHYDQSATHDALLTIERLRSEMRPHDGRAVMALGNALDDAILFALAADRGEQVSLATRLGTRLLDENDSLLANAIHDVDDDVQFIRRDARNLPVLAGRVRAALLRAVETDHE